MSSLAALGGYPSGVSIADWEESVHHVDDARSEGESPSSSMVHEIEGHRQPTPQIQAQEGQPRQALAPIGDREIDPRSRLCPRQCTIL